MTALERAETAAADRQGTRPVAPPMSRPSLSPSGCLRLANATSSAGHPLPFSELTRRVGEAKDAKVALSEEEYLKLASILEHERDA
jgi:hypothetical protein